MTHAAPAPLSIDDLRRARAAARCGHTIEYFDTLESTNTTAAAHARAGASEGTVVIAETQTRGRGRLGRAWVSPPFRNLYLSIVLRPAIPPGDAPRLALVAGLATADAVAEWAPRVALKWPNDVLVDNRKVAGILTEMDADGDHVRFVIAGIGVNLNGTLDDFPAELRDKAGSLAMAVGAPIDRVAFAARVLSCLEARYARFLAHGFAALRSEWNARSCLQGRQVQIDDGGQRHRGIVSGVADDGALCLRDAAGHDVRIVAGEVTVVDGYQRG